MMADLTDGAVVAYGWRGTRRVGAKPQPAGAGDRGGGPGGRGAEGGQAERAGDKAGRVECCVPAERRR